MYARFMSHRARDKAQRVTELGKCFYSLHRDGHYYEVTEEQSKSISHITGVTLRETLPKPEEQWLPVWMGKN